MINRLSPASPKVTAAGCRETARGLSGLSYAFYGVSGLSVGLIRCRWAHALLSDCSTVSVNYIPITIHWLYVHFIIFINRAIQRVSVIFLKKKKEKNSSLSPQPACSAIYYVIVVWNIQKPRFLNLRKCLMPYWKMFDL